MEEIGSKWKKEISNFHSLLEFEIRKASGSECHYSWGCDGIWRTDDNTTLRLTIKSITFPHMGEDALIKLSLSVTCQFITPP